MQYGKQLSEGQFLRYTDAAEVSTGASSFLYMLILGGIATIGLSGTLLLPAAVVLGVLCHGITTACVTRLGTLLLGSRCGIWAGALTAISGPLLWGAASGMEIMLTSALVTGTLLLFTRELPRARFTFTPLLGAVTGLCRPDAMVFVGAICLGMFLAVVLRGQARQRWPRRMSMACWIALPVVVGASQLAVYDAMTGEGTTDGVAAKSLLHPLQFDPFAFFTAWGANMSSFVQVLNGLDGSQFFIPGGIVAAILGVVTLVRRSRAHAHLAWVLAGGLLLSLAALSTLTTATWQHLRYLQPYLPVVILLVVVGVTGLIQALANKYSQHHSGRLVRLAVLGFAVIVTLAAVPTWAGHLGKDSAHMRERVVSLAVWMRENLPSDARVGIHDAGAAGYLSGHPTVDLVGLTTNGLARPGVHGPGSLYEALREMPSSQRPDYLAPYDNLPGGVNLISLADASLFSPTDPVLGIPEMSLYELDWSLADSGVTPYRPPDGVLRDHVNVGSLTSEEKHKYAVEPASPGMQAPTEVRTADYPDRRMVDSARHIVGGEHFTFTGLTPGRDLNLVLRHDATGIKPGVPTESRQVNILVDGSRITEHFLTPGPHEWNETRLTIPGELVRSPELPITIEAPNPQTGPYPDYRSFGYWAYQ